MTVSISGTTQLIGLVATPIRHSISPKMHNAAFNKLGLDYVYLAFDVNESQFEETVKGLKAMGARGFNLSMPYKSTIIPYLDELSPAAKLVQAVNTVVIENNRLIGHMTDGSGLMRSLEEAGYHVKGQKITVVGCGGAGKAIMAQAALEGCEEIAIFNRSVERGQQMENLINQQTDCKATFYELADEEALKEQLKTSSLLINATNVGMAPFEEESIIKDVSMLHKDLLVCDIIYHPKQTKLLQDAKRQGCRVLNGEGMIVYQGAEAFKLWTGYEMPVNDVKEVLGLK